MVFSFLRCLILAANAKPPRLAIRWRSFALSFVERATPALQTSAVRSLLVVPLKRALPPSRPRACACGFSFFAVIPSRLTKRRPLECKDIRGVNVVCALSRAVEATRRACDGGKEFSAFARCRCEARGERRGLHRPTFHSCGCASPEPPRRANLLIAVFNKQ